jgi:peptidoglycan/LPS O-acetylase OafA/YrhL
VARALAGPAVTGVVIVLAALVARLDTGVHPHVHVAFSLLAAPLIPAAVLGTHWIIRPLTSRVLVFIGRRSYAIYLFHPLTLSVVDLVIPPGADPGRALLRLALIVTSTVLLADILYRWLEKPCIRFGRRLAARYSGQPSEPVETRLSGASPRRPNTVRKRAFRQEPEPETRMAAPTSSS